MQLRCCSRSRSPSVNSGPLLAHNNIGKQPWYKNNLSQLVIVYKCHCHFLASSVYRASFGLLLKQLCYLIPVQIFCHICMKIWLGLHTVTITKSVKKMSPIGIVPSRKQLTLFDFPGNIVLSGRKHEFCWLLDVCTYQHTLDPKNHNHMQKMEALLVSR